jgi:DNA polymerase alpha subunit B
MRTIKPDVILLVGGVGALILSRPNFDYLMQTGPFIDGGHQKIKAGDVSKIPLDIFRDIFLESLKNILDLKPGSIALLVPSVRDILSDHAVLPQSELDRNIVDDPVSYAIH